MSTTQKHPTRSRKSRPPEPRPVDPILRGRLGHLIGAALGGDILMPVDLGTTAVNGSALNSWTARRLLRDEPNEASSVVHPAPPEVTKPAFNVDRRAGRPSRAANSSDEGGETELDWPADHTSPRRGLATTAVFLEQMYRPIPRCATLHRSLTLTGVGRQFGAFEPAQHRPSATNKDHLNEPLDATPSMLRLTTVYRCSRSVDANALVGASAQFRSLDGHPCDVWLKNMPAAQVVTVRLGNDRAAHGSQRAPPGHSEGSIDRRS